MFNIKGPEKKCGPTPQSFGADIIKYNKIIKYDKVNSYIKSLYLLFMGLIKIYIDFNHC